MTALARLTLRGFKSIRDVSLDLRAMNVLIGANGAGKSNLVSFFRLLGEIMGNRLQYFIARSGGADSLLFYGAKTNPSLEMVLRFESDGAESEYRARLDYAADDTLVFGEEQVAFQRKDGRGNMEFETLGENHRETKLHDAIRAGNEGAAIVAGMLKKCRAFHFHDTSVTARVRQHADVEDDLLLHADAGNLATILYKYQRHPDARYYGRIVETMRLVAPWFEEFVLEPSEHNKHKILLRWREGRGAVFGPHLLSDGTLRAMALITLLLEPTEKLPSVMVIDEPELGLHPYALDAITGLLRAAALDCQILVATQSPRLVDLCEPEDVIVVDRDGGESTFVRESPERLKDWLDEYSLGELWEKNVIAGGPV
jgi:predicted ATPase